MASIKEVNRSASVAFSPEAPYLAAGTMAGAVDLQFSSSANLDIFTLDFASVDRQLPLAGSVPSSEPFNRLTWGKSPSPSEDFSLGVIAGGLADGIISIWNPKVLIRSDGKDALVANLEKHRGPVRGLEFNSLSSNLLASGADEGEILIWDIAKPNEPTHFPPLKGNGSATQGELSFLSWNSKVQHILASTSFNGTTVVWDLRKQKPVISFSDSVRRRCSSLQWNPDFATQLVVASDDDSSPSLRIWDMRNTMSPLKELVGHNKGVVAMSWCPNDSSYLLTCAKDNRTICWNMDTTEIVTELPAGTNWNFDVHWYPRIPGVISTSSFDGKIGLYNIEAYARFDIRDGDFGAAPLRAPKWYKRKSGVSFGFGGKLVSFCAADSSATSSEVYIQNLVAEHSLVQCSSDFETAVQNGERSSLRLLCDKRSQESESEDDREIWGFLKVMFEDDGTARTKLLTHLGFTLPVEEKDSAQDDLSQEASATGIDDSLGDRGHDVVKGNAIFPTDNGEDFFNNLPSPKAETPVSTSVNNFPSEESVSGWEEMDGQLESNDPSFDDAVQHALVVGDYKGAVAQCISANRIADALIIAHVGGASLWEKTRDQYLKMSNSPYLKVVSAMVNNDLMNLVNTRPLKLWKETLALLCTFAQKDEWTLLCDMLASRLMASGNALAATLCYICAGNIDKTAGIWSKSLTTGHDGKSYVGILQDLMEKTMVLALATGQKKFSASLCKLVEKYAEILASQGLLTSAMAYLKLVGTEEISPELVILRDRITLSAEPEKEASSMAFEIPQSQTTAAYPSDHSGYGAVDAPQQYYQETAPTQLPSGVPASPYGDNYQQPISSQYGRGYSVPAPYQPSSFQPSIFLPPQTPQVPQPSFTPPPVNTQPAVKPFVPATPPTLRNVEQYQQPTLGSQLYPGNAIPNYQAVPPAAGSRGPTVSQAPVPGHNVAPTPPSRGFMPITNSGVSRPGMGLPHPSSPKSSTAQQVVTPAAPPPTVQTADTSQVAAAHRSIVTTLTRLFNETSETLGGSRANPAKKREIEENSKRIGTLFAKLNSGDISKNVAEKLVQLCQALDNGDFSTALQIQVLLTTSDWDECSFWLANLKRMIKTRQSVR